MTDTTASGGTHLTETGSAAFRIPGGANGTKRDANRAMSTRKAVRKRAVPKRQAAKKKPISAPADRRARFAEEYVKDRNATQAAERVGFDPKSSYQQGYRLLRNVDVQRRIAELNAETAERNKVTQDEVISVLRENIERSLQRAAVRDHEGNETGEWRYEGSVVNKAAELLGKTIGIFVERRELTGKDGAPLMPLETLRAALADARDG